MNTTTMVYSGRTTNWPLMAAAGAGGLALLLLGRPWAGPWPGMIVPLVVVLCISILTLMTSTSLRVTTGPRGVNIRWGALGWPRFAYPRERISRGEIVKVSIWRTWNSGISWSARAGWTFVLRSGPAVRLTLVNGRRVTIGVHDPDAALTALTLGGTVGR
jgi:hypothetical protein